MAASSLSAFEVLSDLEDSSTATLWHPDMVLTLPFSHTDVERSSTEKSLQRTRDRWDWFASARERNPSLGTLSYLPYEIRHMIFLKTLASRPIVSADGAWEYDHRLGSPFNVSAYWFGENGRMMIDHSVSGLREVSSSIKNEYEDSLLCQRTFRFNNPESLEAFINRLSDAQKKRVFSIAIGVCILHQMDGWVKSLSQLPSNLNNLQFQIYTTFNDYFQPNSLSLLKDMVQVVARHAPDASQSICGTGREPLNLQCMDFAKQIGKLSPRANISHDAERI